jgi:hypothetical protein
MVKQFRIFIINMFKLIGVMYISIFLKNILQLFLGYLFSTDTDIKIYKVYDIKKSSYTLDYVIELMLLYDFFIFVTIAYLWIYLSLYLIITLIGNKLWFHIIYTIVIYLITILFFDHFHPNILFIIITILLGMLNWYLFKRWIKFNI